MDKLNGVTKNDLLKLKHSKPVPIIAHSMEVVVPVVYSTRVKEFMKREGMKVPLSPEQLSGLKKKARETEGEPDPSYAIGGTVKSRAKERKRLVKGIIPSDLLSKNRKRAAKVKAPGKRLKEGDLKKPSNVKQVVNISLHKIMRTPSTRAKPASNLPIRPGASIAPTGVEPYYQRLVTPPMPSNTTVPGAAPVEPVASLVKPASLPTTVRDADFDLARTMDILKKSRLSKEASMAIQRKRIKVAPEKIEMETQTDFPAPAERPLSGPGSRGGIGSRGPNMPKFSTIPK